MATMMGAVAENSSGMQNRAFISGTFSAGSEALMTQVPSPMAQAVNICLYPNHGNKNPIIR